MAIKPLRTQALARLQTLASPKGPVVDLLLKLARKGGDEVSIADIHKAKRVGDTIRYIGPDFDEGVWILGTFTIDKGGKTGQFGPGPDATFKTVRQAEKALDKIKSTACLQSLAAPTDAQIEKAGKDNVRKLLNALRQNGISLKKGDEYNWELTRKPADQSPAALKDFAKAVIKGTNWKSQGNTMFPSKDDGAFYLEAPTGSKDMASQAVLDFNDMSLFAMPMGNW